MEAPEFFLGTTGYCSQLTPEKHGSGGDHFIVDELLDFSNEDAVVNDNAVDSVAGHSTESSTVTVGDSCNSSSFSGSEPNFGGDIGCGRSLADGQFAGDLCVPHDDLAELDQWLSNFVEESFSSEDLQKLQLISGMKAGPNGLSETRKFEPEHNQSNNNVVGTGTVNVNPIFDPDMSVPAKARSKRSRVASCNWASRLLVLSPTTSSSEPEVVVPNPQPPLIAGKKLGKTTTSKKKDGEGTAATGEGRKCLHCATDKTPQWRTGPMGPKTLCNACGVRYKSGRLVPEYRPAASPTFVLTKHSNSHRKVLELRRQKEMLRAQQQQQQQFLQHHHHQNIVFDVTNGDDYLIHQHVGPDFRQLI
ncbi:hypothetical protein SLE2022_036370 [Rubroshorea leprosula]